MAFQDDIRALVGLLQFTQKLFEQLINRLPPDDQIRFQNVWDTDLHSRLVQVMADLDSITNEDDEKWKRLEGAGLTGPSLALKRHYLAQSAQGGFRRKFLKFLNSVLQSLISAIPGAEPIKELKDYLEDLLEDNPEPDSGLTTLFNNGGFVPFGLS